MLTIAYIGFGVSVREYHIPYVEERSDIRIKYVFRREEDISQNAAYEPFYPDIFFTTDLDKILKDDEVNLVVICSPDTWHTYYAELALTRGKHTLVEKPFAPTTAEAYSIFELASRKNLICMPNQNRRFDADIISVRQVLQSDKLGDLVRLESHYDYFKTSGWYDHLGTLYNLGVHTIDQVIALFGHPDRTVFDVRSIHHPGTGDDYYDIDFFYGNMKATVSTSMCVLIDYPRFTVHGKRGSLILPPAIHSSCKKRTIGKHILDQKPILQERFGFLRYVDDEGILHEESVPVGYAQYGRIYDSLNEAISNGTEKCIRDEEVITVLQILEKATSVARSAANAPEGY